MRPYLAVISARYRMLLQYRAAALAGFVTQLFWGAIRLMILGAFYASTTNEQPMTLPQVVAYVWLGQALLALLPWNVDGDIAEQVRSGNVAYELLRPLNLYTFWFARTLAFRAAATSLRVLPMIVFAGLLLPLLGLGDWALKLPPEPLSLVAFLISITATLLLSTAMTMLMHVILLRTLAGDGINSIFSGAVMLLSGLTIPLPLFPDALQPFLSWQPFRGLSDVPFRIYSGNIVPADAVYDIAQQFFWVAVTIGLGWWLLARTTRRIVVQGG